MLEPATPVAALDRELVRLVRAGERGRADAAADADLGYQQTLVAAAGLPRVATEFARLTWQVRAFLGALDIDLLQTLPRVVAEVQALHAAIVAGDLAAAEQLWRVKFERWIRDLVGKLGEDFDDELWAALTRGRAAPRPARARPPAHAGHR
jgi:DNA-binding GntR family transcriptional regulator